MDEYGTMFSLVQSMQYVIVFCQKVNKTLKEQGMDRKDSDKKCSFGNQMQMSILFCVLERWILTFFKNTSHPLFHRDFLISVQPDIIFPSADHTFTCG